VQSPPALVIISGPNGSGKSFYSSKKGDALINDFGVRSFDFDLAFSKLYQDFLSMMTLQLEQNLSNRVKEIFEESAENAITNKTNFSFQTNFDKPYSDRWRKKFEDAGFKTFLYFLYLDNVELCRQRVEQRVKEGGHYVDQATIIERYKAGIQNFDIFFQNYDEVVFINTSESGNMKKILKIENRKITFADESITEIISSHRLLNLKNLLNQI
jgi:predicted ABC-type ATPase